jgi:hypothetical protein
MNRNWDDKILGIVTLVSSNLKKIRSVVLDLLLTYGKKDRHTEVRGVIHP